MAVNAKEPKFFLRVRSFRFNPRKLYGPEKRLFRRDKGPYCLSPAYRFGQIDKRVESFSRCSMNFDEDIVKWFSAAGFSFVKIKNEEFVVCYSCRAVNALKSNIRKIFNIGPEDGLKYIYYHYPDCAHFQCLKEENAKWFQDAVQKTEEEIEQDSPAFREKLQKDLEKVRQELKKEEEENIKKLIILHHEKHL